MEAPRRQALVGLGTNLGDRIATLRRAVNTLGEIDGVRVLASSSIYETDPVGETDQPKFLNMVVGLECGLTPESLLHALLSVEQEFGRERIVRWGPRTLDLDLLAFEDEERDDEELQLPHPRMLERAFVIVPLREVLRHPPFLKSAWMGLKCACEKPVSTAGIVHYSPTTVS